MNKKSKTSRADRVLQIYFYISLCLVSIAYGMFSWEKQWFPADVVAEAIVGYKSIVNPDTGIAGKEGTGKSADRPLHGNRARYLESGATTHIPELVGPGNTLLTSLWGKDGVSPGIRLIDSKGDVLHHWDVNIKKIFPVKGAILPTYVHGSYLFPNGDVIFNVEYLGLVRLNSCGEVLWATDYRTHHSLHRDKEGNFWVAGYKTIKKKDARASVFHGLSAPFADETLVKFSPDGEILTELSLTEALYNSPYRHLFWHYKRAKRKPGDVDVLHLNDVEPLENDLAKDFPMFEPGDLVVSLKYISAIAVLNQQGEVKWVSAGVFTDQHDPDFEAGGWITVFDNRSDGSHDGKFLGGTKIRAINPRTGQVKDIYPTADASRIYTEAGGKHQLLENGNRLITEARGGRVLEVSPDGRLVWEWVNELHQNKWVMEVHEGTRYPYSIEEINNWSCKPG